MPGKSKKTATSGPAVVTSSLIIGGLLLGAACAMGVLTARMLITYRQAGSWVEVPARIIDLDLERHRGNRSRCTTRLQVAQVQIGRD